MKCVVLLLIFVSLTGCESDETRMSRMADDLCNCFSSVNNLVSAETTEMYDVFEQFATGEINDSTQQEVNKMDSLKIIAIRNEMGQFIESFNKPDMLNCLSKLQGKYGVFFDLQKPGQAAELIDLLATRSECRAATLYLRMIGQQIAESE